MNLGERLSYWHIEKKREVFWCTVRVKSSRSWGDWLVGFWSFSLFCFSSVGILEVPHTLSTGDCVWVYVWNRWHQSDAEEMPLGLSFLLCFLWGWEAGGTFWQEYLITSYLFGWACSLILQLPRVLPSPSVLSRRYFVVAQGSEGRGNWAGCPRQACCPWALALFWLSAFGLGLLFILLVPLIEGSFACPGCHFSFQSISSCFIFYRDSPQLLVFCVILSMAV